jgi:hypothetical protein
MALKNLTIVITIDDTKADPNKIGRILTDEILCSTATQDCVVNYDWCVDPVKDDEDAKSN